MKVSADQLLIKKAKENFAALWRKNWGQSRDGANLSASAGMADVGQRTEGVTPGTATDVSETNHLFLGPGQKSVSHNHSSFFLLLFSFFFLSKAGLIIQIG